ncbi:MAG: hypothetical protein HC860_14750 [Alkalinema sp. RU_4_3]|nr:hypothetical protein [Alkalinema sp. RU_4_3]
MAENTVKLEIQFESLLAAVSSLKTAEKHRLLEMLEKELFEDDDLTNDPEAMADIQEALDDYAAGDYLPYEEFIAQRKSQHHDLSSRHAQGNPEENHSIAS